jgi:2-phosphoglycerate kinase
VARVGGASGVGKTSVSYRLAHAAGVGITEVDDLQIVLEAMTTPAEQPILHRWRTRRDEILAAGDAALLAHTIAYAGVVCEALALVIASHLESDTPLVLEGDFILPALALRETFAGVEAAGRVRAVFVSEESERQILVNYRRREGTSQPERAHASAVFDRWLVAEACRTGLPVVAARPWVTVLKRTLHALNGPPTA